jgi:hypothetical protein
VTSIHRAFAYLRPVGAFVALLATVAIAPSTASANEECWRTLVKDWSDGAISNLYPIGCYRQALANMPEDVRLYSSASDDINRALNGRVVTRGLAASSSASVGGASVVAASTSTGGSGMPFALVGSLAMLLLFGGGAAFLIHRERRGAARLRAPRDS